MASLAQLTTFRTRRTRTRPGSTRARPTPRTRHTRSSSANTSTTLLAGRSRPVRCLAVRLVRRRVAWPPGRRSRRRPRRCLGSSSWTPMSRTSRCWPRTPTASSSPVHYVGCRNTSRSIAGWWRATQPTPCPSRPSGLSPTAARRISATSSRQRRRCSPRTTSARPSVARVCQSRPPSPRSSRRRK